MAEITAFSERNIATRDRLEDYAADTVIHTAGGLNLQLALVCDGAGGGDAGEKAARLTARAIMDHLQISTGTSIPKLLFAAVEQANRVVYSELRGTGTTTLALAVVNLDDGDHGRLYIASVGNSRIYLLRDGHAVRLNIDHVLGNEYIYAGQMSPEEAEKLPNADFITRAVGVNTEMQVDIGFYAERGKEFVSSRRAFRLGQKGLALKEGDSILVTSDGLFAVDPEVGGPYNIEQEFIRYALDDKVDHAGQAIMGYATARAPQDNTALSLLFVPSPRRRAVVVAASLSGRQRAGFGLSLFVVLVLIGFFIFQMRVNEERNVLFMATQTEFQVIVFNLSATAPPTATPTATASLTPTFTPTIRPTQVSADQIGIQNFLESQPVPIFLRSVISSPADKPDGGGRPTSRHGRILHQPAQPVRRKAPRCSNSTTSTTPPNRKMPRWCSTP
ncbi:MAG: hypothetical protein IPO91_02505 [Chloroflexi bacterium]|nr:hypothetical protein [Chloroflexota bacterium]